MQYHYHDSRTGGVLTVCKRTLSGLIALDGDRQNRLLTIAWNTGPEQRIQIDEITYPFPAQSLLPLMMSQTFAFENPDAIVSWQFDRLFYCIADHDQEVSCTGFLFFGPTVPMFVQLSDAELGKFEALLAVFEDECTTDDPIQGEMLRMLLKRLIIKLTRLAKEQHLSPELSVRDYDLVRQFNLLVEVHFRNLHSVSEYAALLNKSPKTIANLFALYHQPSPLRIIHNRIMLEARRLLLFTDKSTKEIAFALGFDASAHFSRFFKKQTGIPPSAFREQQRTAPPAFGKN